MLSKDRGALVGACHKKQEGGPDRPLTERRDVIGKLLVLAAALGGIWVVFKLLAKVGKQNKEILVRRQKEELVKKREHEEREANIIDLEMDPETGDFEERKDDK